jgi:hypothetical protein
MSKSYVLTQTTKSNIEKKHGSPAECARCHLYLRVGDEVVSRTATHTKQYHTNCFEDMRI